MFAKSSPENVGRDSFGRWLVEKKSEIREMALLTEMVTLVVMLELQSLTVMATLELLNCAGVQRVLNQTNILG